MSNEIMSIGIDIGTTTMGMVASKLLITNTAANYMVPDINITQKSIIYRSELYSTPLINNETLDGEKIREIIELEYKKANIKSDDVDTGAVIITGESALKSNAEIVLNSLSEFAGEFVVSTAGPDLESIIAGKGSGAEEFSKTYGCIIANLDIGGGTTNISVFNCGDLVDQTCIDIGGRLLRYDENSKVTYVSDRYNDIAVEFNKVINLGDSLNDEDIIIAGGILAEAIIDSINVDHHTLTDVVTTKTSKPLNCLAPIEFISFSGGVGDCYYSKESNLRKYHDLGVAIAIALDKLVNVSKYKVEIPKETIRATVIGAGIYTTDVSGSTISYNEDIFPIKNLPMFEFANDNENELYSGVYDSALGELSWYKNQAQEKRIGICIRGKKKTSYGELKNLAIALIELDKTIFDDAMPLVIICENDMAKALGQVIRQKIDSKKCVICLDRIKIKTGDYIDIGKPVMGGIAVPVIVKSLIFD